MADVPPLKVLAVASEAYPLVKTGGLGDVVGALPGALEGHGIEVRTLLPGYPAVLARLADARAVHALTLMGGEARIRAARVDGLSVLVLDAPHLFDRPGTPYNDPQGLDWPDNPQRFAALGQAAAVLARGALDSWRPDLVHAHDWQAGLAVAYLHYGGPPAPPTVFTVHNLAFAGWTPAHMLEELGLPSRSFDVEGVEFYGGISPLKAGLRLADRITTVSPTYAAEITRPEHGQGLHGLLSSRANDLVGITNGIDAAVWDPAQDGRLASSYAGPHARRRGRNKAALQAAVGLLDDPTALLFGVVSRLSDQKGIDLVVSALPRLLSHGAQLAVLGSGDRALESALLAAQAAHPGRIGVQIGFDEALAHLIQAGVDALLVPSRFEPCGLTQLCALRYGAVPVVARVGGLADTVIDANPAAVAAGVATGVQFLPVDAAGLESALDRTSVLWSRPADWMQMQRNAMRSDVSWAASAGQYARLFRDLVA